MGCLGRWDGCLGRWDGRLGRRNRRDQFEVPVQVDVPAIGIYGDRITPGLDPAMAGSRVVAQGIPHPVAARHADGHRIRPLREIVEIVRAASRIAANPGHAHDLVAGGTSLPKPIFLRPCRLVAVKSQRKVFGVLVVLNQVPSRRSPWTVIV